MRTYKSKSRKLKLSDGQYIYKSEGERRLADQIRAIDKCVNYETLKIPYIKPAKPGKYSPDFPLANGIIIEYKGRLLQRDREKHLLVKAQHPELDIRFVFEKPHLTITSNSKTTYAMWAEKNGFKWARYNIPEEWFLEEKK
mgnify:CR=1 FL=1